MLNKRMAIVLNDAQKFFIFDGMHEMSINIPQDFEQLGILIATLDDCTFVVEYHRKVRDYHRILNCLSRNNIQTILLPRDHWLFPTKNLTGPHPRPSALASFIRANF